MVAKIIETIDLISNCLKVEYTIQLFKNKAGNCIFYNNSKPRKSADVISWKTIDEFYDKIFSYIASKIGDIKNVWMIKSDTESFIEQGTYAEIMELLEEKGIENAKVSEITYSRLIKK